MMLYLLAAFSIGIVVGWIFCLAAQAIWGEVAA